MRTLAAFLAFAPLAFAKLPAQYPTPRDDQKDVLPPPTPAEMKAFAQSLSMRRIGEQELMRQLQEFRRDPKKFQDLARDPKKLQEFIDQFPPEVRPAFDPLTKPPAEAPQPNPNPFRPDPVTPPPPMLDRPDPGARVRPPPNPNEMRGPASYDPRVRGNPALKNFIRFWEKNVGPLDRTPALRNALAELLTESLSNNSSNNPLNSEFADSLFNADSPLGKELSDFFESATGSNWKMGDIGKWDWNPKLPEVGISAPSGTGGGSVKSDGSSLLNILVAAAGLVILVLVLRKTGLRGLFAAPPSSVKKTAPIVFCPDAIHDRETLIQQYEALSLRTIGPEAATWNHRTIAAAMRHNASEIAADYYEFARYAPDPMTDDAVAAARQCLKSLGEAMRR